MGYDIEVLTFHKLGLKLLNNDNYSIISDNYLSYIIEEYFNSFIKYDKKRVRTFKDIFFSESNFNKLTQRKEFNTLKRTIETFIHLAKSNNLSDKDLVNIYNRTFFNEKKIMKMILEILTIYKRELVSSGSIDFDDMISLAKEKVITSNIPYKFIIIDEFQDTSLVRFNLIKEIINKNNAKVFVVGDDWQSIYRFSGCNLDLFINFNKFFRDTKYFYLKYTYRNSNELINASASFVMKNKHQLKKNIVSNKNLDKPIKILFNYSLKDILDLINDDDYLILGRNNKDINYIDGDKKLTIHRSKGLEAKNIILVNSDSIPSLIKNERILRFVLKEKDYILYEEERRLFYVALTRTKEYIYIQVNKKISPFVKELIHDYPEYIEVLKK